jgi:hypothetical protein
MKTNVLSAVNDKDLQEKWWYDYSGCMDMEPIIQTSASPKRSGWFITRNRFGALVLNTKNVMFVDVDCIDLGLDNKQKSLEKRKCLSKIKNFLRKQSIDAAIFETHSGYRVLVTDREVSPNSYEAYGLMMLIDADPLYRILCERQKCYRARLNPKPFRIGVPEIVVKEHTVSRKETKEWISLYNKVSMEYSVCKEVLKPQKPIERNSIQQIYGLHALYCINENKPLA